MYQQNIVLCGANAYTKKYYLNDDFGMLPEGVQAELKIMCVLYTEDVGGVLTLKFEEEGTLIFETSAKEEDLLFDEIGSALKIKQMQKTKADMLRSLELFFKVFFLEEDIEEITSEKIDV
ncbi:DUF6145 family protein [Lachnospiraceae bacterium ZAX-1]